jgi:hypothetical protein
MLLAVFSGSTDSLSEIETRVNRLISLPNVRIFEKQVNVTQKGIDALIRPEYTVTIWYELV